MTTLLLLEDYTTLVHSVAFAIFISLATYGAIQEYANAVESWTQLWKNNANLTQLDAAEMDWEEEEQNSRKLFQHGEIVVHSDLGLGRAIVDDDKLKEKQRAPPGKTTMAVWVEFDILNEPRLISAKDLLFIGQRVRHKKRGLGTLLRFDEEEERAHVQFDNGEYHRYHFAAWKRKMGLKQARHSDEEGDSHLLPSSTSTKSFQQFFRDYMLYRIDYMLSAFTFSKPLVLFCCTYTLIVVGASAYSAASDKSWLEASWIAWTMVADPGTHTGEEGTAQRAVALALSLGGMLVFALMIGIIADGVSSLLDELKQGHSFVIETGHTLILGWSDKTLPFVREICLANESAHGGVIVILADRAKVEMETELHLTREESKGTLVICRSGNPVMHSDLLKVSAGSARSVVILADRSLDADESDARAVRCILALQNVRKRRMGHIVVEMCDVANRDLGLLADSTKHVEIIVAHDMIGRFMIQCAREPGLSQVLKELLGFEGDEFYLKQCPELDGTEFGQVLFRFEDAIPLGVKPKDRFDAYEQLSRSAWRRASLQRRDWDGNFATATASAPMEEDTEEFSPRESNKVILNPPNDYVLRPGDELVVLAQDDDTYASKPFARLPKSALASYAGMQPAHRPIRHARAERFLFCGWRRDMDDMILELDKVVGRGSEVVIMCTTSVEKRLESFAAGGLVEDALVNLKLQHVVGNPFLRRDLNRIRNELCQFDSVLILADQNLEGDIPSADSRSLACLLLVRDMIRKQLLVHGSGNTPSSSMRRRNSSSNNGSGKQFKTQSASLDSGDTGSFRRNLQNELLIEQQEEEQEQAAGTEKPFLRFLASSRRMASNNVHREVTESKRHLLFGSPSPRTSSLLLGECFVKRLSAVGAALYFENAHHTGNTVLISEILDSRTKALLPVANVGDHVMSNELVAATLAMVSECRAINDILGELLRADGNDLHLRSAIDYGRLGEKLDFWQLQARARARGEICLGYRNAGDKAPTLNPREKCAKFTLHPKATVIVISED